jgi:hypothetical protein
MMMLCGAVFILNESKRILCEDLPPSKMISLDLPADAELRPNSSIPPGMSTVELSVSNLLAHARDDDARLLVTYEKKAAVSGVLTLRYWLARPDRPGTFYYASEEIDLVELNLTTFTQIELLEFTFLVHPQRGVPYGLAAANLAILILLACLCLGIWLGYQVGSVIADTTR